MEQRTVFKEARRPYSKTNHDYEINCLRNTAVVASKNTKTKIVFSAYEDIPDKPINSLVNVTGASIKVYGVNTVESENTERSYEKRLVVIQSKCLSKLDKDLCNRDTGLIQKSDTGKF